MNQQPKQEETIEDEYGNQQPAIIYELKQDVLWHKKGARFYFRDNWLWWIEAGSQEATRTLDDLCNAIAGHCEDEGVEGWLKIVSENTKPIKQEYVLRQPIHAIASPDSNEYKVWMPSKNGSFYHSEMMDAEKFMDVFVAVCLVEENK